LNQTKKKGGESKMKNIQNLIVLLLGVVFTLLSVTTASAAQVTRLSVSLSDSRPEVSNNHTWSFTHTQAATLKSITFNYCTAPSGGCIKPGSLITSTATKGSVSGLTDADWTLNAAGGAPRLENITANGQGISARTPISITLNSITNNPIAGSNCTAASNNSTATCYVQLATFTSSDGLSGLTDEGIASYTVVSAVTVSARVDPTFTFVVSLVADATSHNGITTSVASTYNTLPFGNLTAGTPKYAAHQLNVTTNTENGYTVNMKMLTQMTGVYTANNIDPFVGNSAVWGTPQDWTHPNGNTPNTNTGWIGANTTDADVAGWSGQPMTGKFGPVESTDDEVMRGLRSDSGATPVYVTYALEANVFQPADTYTGTIVYNALPTY
jgi:hypothetical protein